MAVIRDQKSKNNSLEIRVQSIQITVDSPHALCDTFPVKNTVSVQELNCNNS